ncbi:hypothetical protein TNCV_3709331 [Trichonephila clavipes]|nr:hypothetical protein TNCV_3709331 [Trichonephila clavipes]
MWSSVRPFSIMPPRKELQDHRNGVFPCYWNKTGSRSLPNQKALRIASGTEPTLIRKENTTPLISCPVLCSLHHCKRWRRWPAFNRRQRSGRWANMPPLSGRLATVNRDTCRPVAVQSC